MILVERKDGTAKERWIPESDMAAGDLLHQFRAARHAAARAAALPFGGDTSLPMIATVEDAANAIAVIKDVGGASGLDVAPLQAYFDPLC